MSVAPLIKLECVASFVLFQAFVRLANVVIAIFLLKIILKMDIENHLILVKGEDKTEEIVVCLYQNNKANVTFKAKNGSTQKYSYNPKNIEWLEGPEDIPVSSKPLCVNGIIQRDIKKILRFDDYIRLIPSCGKSLVCKKNDLQQAKKNDPLVYLQLIAEQVGEINKSSENDTNASSFLAKQYKTLNEVNSDSCLYQYLNKDEIGKEKSLVLNSIFPFGINLSQKKAVEKALNNKISVIEGPPGTGKTQTILNIIANILIQNKTVAVVSNNNSATANVIEKLAKYDLGFLAAFLGNKENKNTFFVEQSGKYPEIDAWGIDQEKMAIIKGDLEEDVNEIKELLGQNNELSVFQQEYSELIVQQTYFMEMFKEKNISIENVSFSKKIDSDTVLKTWVLFEQEYKKKGKIGLITRIKYLFKYGIASWKFFSRIPTIVVLTLQKIFFEKREQELIEKIDHLEKRLEKVNFKLLLLDYSSKSMELFKATLSSKYAGRKHRKRFSEASLFRCKLFDEFITEYPIIMSTTHSLRNCAPRGTLFDYVIMDEASQIDVVTGGLALSCAKNTVIVGDLMQLPNILPNNLRNITEKLFQESTIDEAYNYCNHSILSSIVELKKGIPRTLLREHYRCHPKIIGFCNQKFYDDELIIMTNYNEDVDPLVVYKTVKGNHARSGNEGGKFNQRQIDVLLEEVMPEKLANVSSNSIGVISPYRMQVDTIQVAIGEAGLEVDTVHKFQGREKEIVVLSTVANVKNAFVDDPNLLNVAISRAEKQLIVIVADNESFEGSNIGDLIKYIDYNNFQIIDSRVFSVFDLLYKQYSQKLLEYYNNKTRVSEHDSENLMNDLIDNVLKLERNKSLAQSLHYPMYLLVRKSSDLSLLEEQYAKNELTHVDFLIYSKIHKKPMLAIEVDGYRFHAAAPKQLARDKMKNAILSKCGIQIIRFATNESNEEKRLINQIDEVMKCNRDFVYH